MKPDEIGRWVFRRRRELGLTLAELQTMSGVSDSTLRRIEQGRVGVAYQSVSAAVEALRGVIQVEKSDGSGSSGQDSPA